MNLVEATAHPDHVAFGGLRVPVDAPPQSGRVILGIRPEAFEDAAFAEPHLPRIDVEVAVVEDLGADAHVIFPIDAPRLDSGEIRDAADGEDETLLAEDARALLTARVDARSAARVGERLTLAVDTSRFHYFSAATGTRLAVDEHRLPSPDEGGKRVRLSFG
jgi:multiple sugar transport system ATP-binding protein